jgi:serine/threonine protein kinase
LHFHSKGFIHRDIKPSNILIQNTISGQNSFVIADFGFVKNLDEKPKDSFNVGTPVYMAPESITSNVYTVKSDIWSIGVMLF